MCVSRVLFILGLGECLVTFRSVTVGTYEKSGLMFNRSSAVSVDGILVYSFLTGREFSPTGVASGVDVTTDVGGLESGRLLSTFLKFSLKDLWAHVNVMADYGDVNVSTERTCVERGGDRFAEYVLAVSGRVCLRLETALSRGMRSPAMHECSSSCCVRNAIRNAVETAEFCAQEVFDVLRSPDVAVYRFLDNDTHEGLACVASDYIPGEISMSWRVGNTSIGGSASHVLRHDHRVESGIGIRVPKHSMSDYVCQVDHPSLRAPINVTTDGIERLSDAPCVLRFTDSCPSVWRRIFLWVSCCFGVILSCACVLQVVVNYTYCVNSANSWLCCIFKRRTGQVVGVGDLLWEDRLMGRPYRWSEMTVALDE